MPKNRVSINFFAAGFCSAALISSIMNHNNTNIALMSIFVVLNIILGIAGLEKLRNR